MTNETLKVLMGAIVVFGFISTLFLIYINVKNRQKPKFGERLGLQLSSLFMWVSLALLLAFLPEHATIAVGVFAFAVFVGIYPLVFSEITRHTSKK